MQVRIVLAMTTTGYAWRDIILFYSWTLS